MSDLRALFEEYDQTDAKVEQCKVALEAATTARSNVVSAIAAVIAPKKRLVRNGRELTIVVRGSTHFFRGAKSSDDTVVVE